MVIASSPPTLQLVLTAATRGKSVIFDFVNNKERRIDDPDKN